MDKFEDTIFTPYISGVIIKAFEESTGCTVSEFYEIELKNFIYEWSQNCLKDAING